MSKIPRNVQRAFLISSFIGATLKSHNTGSPKLLALGQRANNAMKVYAYKAGIKSYNQLVKDGLDMWTELAEEYKSTLQQHEIEAFIASMGQLIPKQDYVSFLAMKPYETDIILSPELSLKVSSSLLALNDKVNKLLKTTSPTYSIIKKKEKVKKQRVKTKSKKQLKHEEEVKLEGEKKERKKKFLQSINARAKILKKVSSERIFDFA